MIWFWIVNGLLTLVALAALLRPLIWRAGRGANEGEAAVAMFRRHLVDIDRELAQGRLASNEAAAARIEITRRMLAAADREREQGEFSAANPGEVSWRIGAAVGVAGLLPAAALAIYFAVGAPAAFNPPAAAGTARGAGAHDITELAAAADQLKVRLEREPEHPEGWVLLGRTLASLRRFGEAREAYGRAIALKPDEPGLHAEAPPDAPWRNVVAARLAEIAPSEPQPRAKTSAGPTAQEIAAARSTSPEERQAMIRSMVERLAARLEKQPDDKEGWARLAHAYDVLGETDKAQAARVRAVEVGAPVEASPSNR